MIGAISINQRNSQRRTDMDKLNLTKERVKEMDDRFYGEDDLETIINKDGGAKFERDVYLVVPDWLTMHAELDRLQMALREAAGEMKNVPIVHSQGYISFQEGMDKALDILRKHRLIEAEK
jgi:hypothetical protein